MGRNELYQCSPGNHPIHLGKQFLLAGLLGTQVQVQAALLLCPCVTCTMTGLRPIRLFEVLQSFLKMQNFPDVW